MTDLVERLRRYKRERSGYAEYCHQAADKIEAQAERISELEKQRDAAFAMTRCECGAEEACWNLVKAADQVRVLREALEVAKSGLEWYYESCPKLVTNCDHEAMAQIDSALEATK